MPQNQMERPNQRSAPATSDGHPAPSTPPSSSGTREPAIASYCSLEAIEALRPAWKALCRHCDADIDFVQQIVSKRTGFLRPHVLVASTSGGIDAMLAGRAELRPWRFWLRHRTNPGQSVSVLTIPAGGVFGAKSSAECNQLVAEVWHALRRGEFDIALFGGLEKGAPLYNAVRSIPPFFCRDHGLKHEIHWLGRLPGTQEAFLGRISSGHRKAFRSKQRKLDAAFPGKVQFRVFTQPGEADELAAAAGEIARQTYQYRRGGSFRPSEEGKNFLDLAARNGWLRGYVLYTDNRPVAFWIGTLYQGLFRLDTTGYLQDYKDFDVGVILFLYMIDDLCKRGVKELDFGTGDSAFKSRFGDLKSEIATVCMFAPTLKGVVLMAIKCVRSQVESIGRRVAAFVGVEQALRRIWRSLPPALRIKQSLKLALACLGIIAMCMWQGWLKWPVGTVLIAVLCVLTALEVARRMTTDQPHAR